MSLDRKAAIERLKMFDFPALFTQVLGWDWYTAETKITANKADFTLKGVAEKRGVHVFHCLPGPDGRIPDAGTISAIERQVVKLASVEVREINDLITYNLDIEQFAQDVVQNCEGPDLLRAVWNAVSNISVLDPTCESAAFSIRTPWVNMVMNRERLLPVYRRYHLPPFP
ncbi:MAG TPA: hypothetical protein PJ991_13185 [Kiritimatiellia bacterium]|nr:hypothetical protein [Kiritimatiellia bacterium]